MMNKLLNRILYKFFSMMEFRTKKFLSCFYYQNLVKRLKKVPEGLHISGRLEVIFPQGLLIGDNVHIGHNAYFNCRGGVVIGDNCYMGNNVSLISTKPHFESSVLPFSSEQVPGRIIIGKGVYIGMNVSILPGVKIGDGAVIGTGSVVTKDVEKGVVIKTSLQDQNQFRNWNSFLTNYDDNKNGGEEGKNLNEDSFKKKSTLLYKSFNEAEGPVFILSTGRSGSKAIAAFLNQYPDIQAYHELYYDFLKVLSSNFLAGKIDKSYVKKELINLYSSTDNFDSKKYFVDSDQKLAPFVDILKEIFPQSKFVWLIRSPNSFLSSARARGWFQNDTPVFNERTVLIQKEYYSHGTRITGDTLNKNDRVQNWSDYSTDDRILWYWYYWNNLIKSQLEKIPEQDQITVKLEQLDSKKREIINFIGTKYIQSHSLKKTNKVKKNHQKNYSAKVNSEKITECLEFYNQL